MIVTSVVVQPPATPAQPTPTCAKPATSLAYAPKPTFSQPPPPRIAGGYDSNYGRVHIEQNGTTITGTYECCGGGTIRGRLDVHTGTIKYQWRQPGATGRGVWRLVDNRLVGEWGYGQSQNSGGAWNLTPMHN